MPVVTAGWSRVGPGPCGEAVRHGRISEPDRRPLTNHVPSSPGFLWRDHRNEGMGQPDQPYKWRAVREHPTVRPNRDEPAITALGDVAEIRGRCLLTEALFEKVEVLGVQSVTIHPTPEVDAHGWSVRGRPS